ncbi:alpha/beta hydrolase [Streptomyces sp. NPDC050504]|uniref:alpha/beta hydrolase n=1 Tax=Streptomyces sp. NPDC050504 TaxID=3365618 RepID=UPI0037A9CE40
MSLTGTPFFLTTIVLLVVAVLLPLLLWARVRGPFVVRAAQRLVMLAFAQVTAIAVVFVMVNNTNSLYGTWEDLLGTGDHVNSALDLGPDGMGGQRLAALPKVEQKFSDVHEDVMGKGVRMTELSGRISGAAGEVYVWLPPQYDDPAYRNKKFPVVEMFPGFPGSPKAWFGTLKVQRQLKPLMERGEVAPFILVAPRTTLFPREDHSCANIPGKVNADSWLTVDVRKMITDNFRAIEKPEGWALAGYSAGGHCAAKLALQHPDRYSAAVSLSGYNDPAAERSSLIKDDQALRDANNPRLILRAANAANKPPRVSLYVSGARNDGYEAGLALQREAQSPTLVAVKQIEGAHDTGLWKRQVPEAFQWLTQQMRLRANQAAQEAGPGAADQGGTALQAPRSRNAGPRSGEPRRPATGDSYAKGAEDRLIGW